MTTNPCSGTAKQHVANDYMRQISAGLAIASAAVTPLPASRCGLRPTSAVTQCHSLNESLCTATQALRVRGNAGC